MSVVLVFRDMKTFIKNKQLQIAFTVVGALGGFLYWKNLLDVPVVLVQLNRYGIGVHFGEQPWVIWQVTLFMIF